MAVKVNDILAHFDRTADQYLSRDDFKAKLRAGKPLRIKYGVDVRTPTLHIGHAVNLWLMRYLQDLGHKVVFVIGDFTTRIGDPDGRLETHGDLPEADVENNIKTFLEQARMVLRFDNPELLEVRRNSEWYNKLSMREFMEVSSLITHARLMARDMFQMRMAQGNEIYLQEMLYPVLQAYDSLVVESDLAIVGSDQFFNESLGRLLQEKHGKSPQALITTKITPGTDGKGKQSKSMGNYVGLLHSPRDKFGRIMSIPDHLIEEYFRIYTDVPFSEISGFKAMVGKKPRDAKMALAAAIVERYHGHDAALGEREWFENTISKGQVPEDLPTLAIVCPRMETLDLVQLARPGKSKGDTRRLLKQGAVELNGVKLVNPEDFVSLHSNDILKVGKRNWFRIQIVELHNLESKLLWLKSAHVEDIDFLVKYVPSWEMVKYLDKEDLVKKDPVRKPTLENVRDVFKKVLLQPEPRDDWVWKISKKDEPEKVIGIAHLRRDGRLCNQHVWLSPETQSFESIMNEAMFAVNEYAFSHLGYNSLAFKNAFAYATAPKDLDVLARSLISMDTGQLSRDVPMGTVGFTADGWEMMQQWRRTMTPWLFQNEPSAPQPQQQQKKPEVLQAPPPPPPEPAKPKPKPRAKIKNPFMIDLVPPKPTGSDDED